MKQIIESFEHKLSELTEKEIEELAKFDHSIFNVKLGFHKESFGNYSNDDNLDLINYTYFLTYISKCNSDCICGYKLELKPYLKTRNRMTNFFSNFICEKFSFSDNTLIFNTFQDLQRTLFEKLDLWTYDDSFFDELEGKNVNILLKGKKGLIYVPFVNTDVKKTDHKENISNNKSQTSKESTFVYLMYNNNNGYYKIGYSSNPKYREKTLQAEESDIVLIDKWISTQVVENLLHKRIKEKRLRGEWFNLDESDIAQIKEFMDVYDDFHKK